MQRYSSRGQNSNFISKLFPANKIKKAYRDGIKRKGHKIGRDGIP
jgi:hypothetical protein